MDTRCPRRTLRSRSKRADYLPRAWSKPISSDWYAIAGKPKKASVWTVAGWPIWGGASSSFRNLPRGAMAHRWKSAGQRPAELSVCFDPQASAAKVTREPGALRARGKFPHWVVHAKGGFNRISLRIHQGKSDQRGFSGSTSTKVPGRPIIFISLREGIGVGPLHIWFARPVRLRSGRIF